MTLIYDQEVEAEVGSIVNPDGWGYQARPLLATDSDDLAAFRISLPSGEAGGPIKTLPVNVRVTGRSWQRRQGDTWVRVQIEFVGDGEPSVMSGGWMRPDPWK